MDNQNSVILNSKPKDSGAKKIFDDPLLCAQFLRDYIKGIPCLENVTPEDIEDVSGQFVPLFSEERNSDSVKRIRTKESEESFFVISLIEHKTYVEYNVCMQIFRYMVYIWEAYEKEMEAAHKGISHTKAFRYPPILPIVYYEGHAKWDAPLQFAGRINMGDLFAEYLPSFKYYLIQLSNYSNGELLEKKDEISLVMLINKLQTLEDISKFRAIPPEELQEILASTPDRIIRLIADILRTLLLKINVPEEQTEDIVSRVKEKKMGQLFENFEPVDIQEEWRKLDVARNEIHMERSKLDSERSRLDSEKSELNDQRKDLNIKEKNLQRIKGSLQEKEGSLQEKENSLQQKEESLQAERMESIQIKLRNEELERELENLKLEYEKLKGNSIS